MDPVGPQWTCTSSKSRLNLMQTFQGDSANEAIREFRELL
jgi:hypothetical protein